WQRRGSIVFSGRPTAVEREPLYGSFSGSWHSVWWHVSVARRSEVCACSRQGERLSIRAGSTLALWAGGGRAPLVFGKPWRRLGRNWAWRLLRRRGLKESG